MPKFVVVRCMGWADGRSCPHEGQYLKSYDPDFMPEDGHDQRTGLVVWTSQVDEAMSFKDVGAALVFCRQQSRTRPIRPDGYPNRPLTAFNLELTNHDGRSS